jgi:hypothetical protein
MCLIRVSYLPLIEKCNNLCPGRPFIWRYSIHRILREIVPVLLLESRHPCSAPISTGVQGLALHLFPGAKASVRNHLKTHFAAQEQVRFRSCYQ